ncbi:MAG: polysaccharide biosynthesis/export family protein [bacterium]|nr:polysaccharide biosynthesis/export family protein [bacterium]
MRYLLILLGSLVIASSCKIMRSNLMLKTPRDFTFDNLVDSLARRDYKIAPNDAITYRVFTNNGFKLINLATESSTQFRNDLDVIVQSDDSIKMPLIGRVHIAGLTAVEAEKMLEKKYSEFYVDPFVSVRISNRRVIVFPGNGGLAKVLALANNNTTIMEALASAGGILEDGKAYRVKVVRNNPLDPIKPLVYLFDLSKIGGIKEGRSIVQAGDIIYVEPRYRPIATFNKEITPILSLLASILILFQFTKLL